MVAVAEASNDWHLACVGAGSLPATHSLSAYTHHPFHMLHDRKLEVTFEVAIIVDFKRWLL